MKVKGDSWVPGVRNRKNSVAFYEDGSGSPKGRFWGDEDIRTLVLDKFENLLYVQEEISNSQLDTGTWNSGREVQAVDKI